MNACQTSEGAEIKLHDLVDGNTARVDALIGVFVDGFPQYARNAGRLRLKARLPADAHPCFIVHQFLLDIAGQAAGMISFKYSPARDMGLVVYLTVEPEYRATLIDGQRAPEWLISQCTAQLTRDANTAGCPSPACVCFEVEPQRLVARYRSFGFVEFPVEYYEPLFRLPGPQVGAPVDLSGIDFARRHLGAFPIDRARFCPFDLSLLTQAVLMYYLDHYHLPPGHWCIQRTLQSIRAIPTPGARHP